MTDESEIIVDGELFYIFTAEAEGARLGTFIARDEDEAEFWANCPLSGWHPTWGRARVRRSSCDEVRHLRSEYARFIAEEEWVPMDCFTASHLRRIS
jgi:hypothetical protein